MVCHTVNPRLSSEQIVFVINDAQDCVLFYDEHFSELVESLRPQCSSVAHRVPLRESVAPSASEENYGAWLGNDTSDFEWPVFDEDTACGLCFTSGTTGAPKGALYSRRSTVLHAYASIHPNALAISAEDTVMPLVPMFHANAWGLP